MKKQEVGLEAGVGLDELIAEKVMGLMRMKGKLGYDGGFWDPIKKRTQMIKDSPLHEQRKKMGIDYDAPGDGFVLAYSTDITAAWQVVEKVRELGYYFILKSYGDIGAPGRWWAYFQNRIGDESINGYGHEAPLAICRAALKAMEGK